MAGLFGSANTRCWLRAGPSLLASARLFLHTLLGANAVRKPHSPHTHLRLEMNSALRKATAGFQAPGLQLLPQEEGSQALGSEVVPAHCGQVLRARIHLASRWSLSHRPSWALCCTGSARRSCGGEASSSSCADSA